MITGGDESAHRVEHVLAMCAASRLGASPPAMSAPLHGLGTPAGRILAHERNHNHAGGRAGRAAMKIEFIEAACWGAGLALIALYSSAKIDGEIERQAAVSEFLHLHGEPSEPVFPAQLPLAAARADVNRASGAVPDQMQWSAGRIRSYAATAADEPASAPPAAAVLRIAHVALEVPVYAESSERNLNRGAVLIAGTGAPDGDGNIAIAAHRDGYFRALQSVAVGDLIELQTTVRRRQYRITELSIVDPTDISPLYDTEEPAVTLVTCYPFYFVGRAPQRYIVRAIAVD